MQRTSALCKYILILLLISLQEKSAQGALLINNKTVLRCQEYFGRLHAFEQPLRQSLTPHPAGLSPAQESPEFFRATQRLFLSFNHLYADYLRGHNGLVRSRAIWRHLRNRVQYLREWLTLFSKYSEQGVQLEIHIQRIRQMFEEQEAMHQQLLKTHQNWHEWRRTLASLDSLFRSSFAELLVAIQIPNLRVISARGDRLAEVLAPALHASHAEEFSTLEFDFLAVGEGGTISLVEVKDFLKKPTIYFETEDPPSHFSLAGKGGIDTIFEKFLSFGRYRHNYVSPKAAPSPSRASEADYLNSKRTAQLLRFAEYTRLMNEALSEQGSDVRVHFLLLTLGSPPSAVQEAWQEMLGGVGDPSGPMSQFFSTTMVMPGHQVHNLLSPSEP